MINPIRPLRLGLALALAVTLARAAGFVAVYSGPDPQLASPFYGVAVTQNGTAQESFTYISRSLDPSDAKIREDVVGGIAANPVLRRHYTGKDDATVEEIGRDGQSASWTTFSFSGKATVTVEFKSGPVQDVKVLPTAAGIQPRVEGRRVSFEVDRPLKLAVVINHRYLNPLFVFADGPELAVPDATLPGALVFKPGDPYRERLAQAARASVVIFTPGMHDIGVGFPVSANQTIYVAGGAYLRGTLFGENANNVTIRGRGIIAGDLTPRAVTLANKRTDRLANLRLCSIAMISDLNRKSWNLYFDRPGLGCDNLLIEGVTIANPAHFFTRLAGTPITVHNVKMVAGWHYNTDGISAIGMPNVTVYDCFFQCNDDGVYVSPQGVHIHHCTFWHNDNGSPFQFNWGGDPITLGGGFIHDCDVIHFGVTRENNNRVVFGSRKSGPGDIAHIRFRDIRVEGPVWRLFRINTYYSNSSRNAGQPAGSIRDVVFENIACSGPQLNPSEVIAQEKAPVGAAPNASKVEQIVFRNVTLQGRPLAQEDLLLGKTNVSGIVVEKAVGP